MQMGQSQSLSQSMRQEMTLSHQQIQAINMLAAPVMELESLVSLEVEKNPVLELEREDKEVSIDEKENDWLDRVLDLETHSSAAPMSYSSPQDEAQREYFFNSISTKENAEDMLIEQVRFLDLDEELMMCTEKVIAELDDRGYMTMHPADLAMVAEVDVKVATKAIKVVQGLEPAGVGAKDLKERLLIQLDRRGRKKSKTYEMVKFHLEEVASNKLPQVARKLRVTMEHLHELLEEVKGLSPTVFAEEVSPMEYVREEVTVTEDEFGQLEVVVNNGYIPSLRISNAYRKLLNDPDVPKDTKSYVRDKIRAAAGLIKSLGDRQSTLERVARCIVKHQEGFFLNGVEHMVPLTMSQVAEEVGFHETTISRTVAGKFVGCKFGLLPLRQFFTSGCSSEDGEKVSSTAIKSLIRKFIDLEEGKKPLSDSKLEKMLATEGYKVARRTVAKYRESMNIPPSNLRRKF